MIRLEVEYLSPEWFSARCGIPTASAFDKIITSKGEPSTQAKKYLYQLAGERIIGSKMETYQSAAMARGIEMESEARSFYELVTGNKTEDPCVCYMDEQRKYSCSPDAFVPPNGLLEIKCPTLPVAVEYLVKGKLPTTYFQQCQGQLFITGMEYLDFCSYYPGLNSFIIKVEPDLKFHAKLEEQLESFIFELAKTIKKLKEVG